jgi:hypothetical protein
VARSLNAMEFAGKEAMADAVSGDRQIADGFRDLFFKI